MMKTFGHGMLAGFVAVPALLATSYAALSLFAPASVPAPAISRLVHLDEKFRFLRRHPEIDPNILAVGSSLTWRQLAGHILEARAGGPHRFLNGGTGFLRTDQTRALTKFYLAHFRRVRTVLVMIGLPDFRDCTTEPRAMFGPEAAARYAFGGWPAFYFYLRYFSPRRYAKMAATLAGRQTPFTGDMYLDAYGSSPVDLPDSVDLGLRYGSMDRDPACVDALVGLAHDVKERGLHLVMVFTPVHPKYRARYPEAMRWIGHVAARMERERQRMPENLTVLSMVRDPTFAADDFYDAFHLQWPAVKTLSTRIAGAMDAMPFVPPEEGLYSRHPLHSGASARTSGDDGSERASPYLKQIVDDDRY